VKLLSVRERILMIRLSEMAAKHPAYAKALGVDFGQQTQPVGRA